MTDCYGYHKIKILFITFDQILYYKLQWIIYYNKLLIKYYFNTFYFKFIQNILNRYYQIIEYIFDVHDLFKKVNFACSKCFKYK